MTGALDGRRAVVTGAAQGIGREIARELLAQGARVTLLDLNPEALEAAVAELREATPNAAPAAVGGERCDVSDAGEVRDAFARAAERMGGLDVLVNNAGIRRIGGFLEATLEDWQQTLDVDLTGPYLCCRAAAPYMLERGDGRIVNVASVAGQLAFRNRLAYNVAKAGVIMLTKSVALELGARGIRCNAVAPGVIETPLTAEYFTDPELADTITANTPSGRWGQPQDLAGPVAFLCSDAAAFVQGTTLFVDGGWVASKGY
jgi:NAD(P)-dependent dehydrogenase (short-subunit alcohol dehydrogenase family)